LRAATSRRTTPEHSAKICCGVPKQKG
jgi:hypothetical protein